MATLYISEFAVISIPGAPIAPGEVIASQTVAIGGSSTQSNAFNAQTRYVRVNTDAACSVVFGANPTATTSNERWPADQTDHRSVEPGSKIAVIANT